MRECEVDVQILRLLTDTHDLLVTAEGRSVAETERALAALLQRFMPKQPAELTLAEATEMLYVNYHAALQAAIMIELVKRQR